MDILILREKIKEFDIWVHDPSRIPAGSPISFGENGKARYLYNEETEFKKRIYENAQAALDFGTWEEADIGTGRIINRLKAAINCDNNGIIHRRQKIDLIKTLNNALENAETCLDMEAAIYDLYKTENDQQSMDTMISIFHRRYDVLSFLFFIKNDEKYLPVKAAKFDEALKMAGIDYKLSGNCGWSNYKGFMAILRDIAEELNASLKMESKATLMDAHSFLWIIGNQMQEGNTNTEEKYPEFRHIFVGDGYKYKTQKEIALYFHKKAYQDGGIVNLNEKYRLWFIHTDKPDANWKNDISEDVITEINRGKPHKDETEDVYRIAFANTDGKSFKFIGVFKLVDCGSKSYLEKNYRRVGEAFYTGDIEDTTEYDMRMDHIIDKAIEALNISDTEKEALVKSRVGQGMFRRNLQDKYGKCALCGMINSKLLVASHIKEWKDSDDTERLDVNNGLLLCALHDSLFDKHLISFDDGGNILISQELSEDDRRRCGIEKNMRIELKEKMKKYMQFHREVFQR